jgi:magnesium transporter
MKIINYNDINNNEINILVVEKLLFKNNKILDDNLDKYYLIEYPVINFNNNEYDNYNDIFFNILNEKKFENINIIIPELVLTKIIFCKVNNSNFLIKSNNYKVADTSNILTLFIKYTNTILNDFGIFFNIISKISDFKTNISYFNSYYLVEAIDLIQKYLFYYQENINQFKNISNIFSDKNEINIKFIENINLINKKYITIYNLLNDNRHSVMQRIAYLETGMSRLLTIVATIFLPMTFIVSFFSMPFKNMPFKNNKYGILYIVLIIIILIIIILNYLFQDIYQNFFRFF